MRSIRKSAVTALTAAIALSLGAIPAAVTAGIIPGGDAPTTTVAPATTVGFGSQVSGYVAIERTNATTHPGQSPRDQIEWFSSDGTGSRVVQTINTAAPDCLLRTTPLDDKAATAGSPLPVLRFDGQFGSNSQAESWSPGTIGVAEKKSGMSCSQVNAGETLNIGIGPGVTTPTGAAATVAKSAYLDVELKQDARILATATLGGTVVGYFELQSGSTIGAAQLPGGTSGVPYPAAQTCNNPSDSGPDSGVNDNCRWAISTPTGVGSDDGITFDTLSLKAVNGSFSLEYGRDGTVTSGEQRVGTPSFIPAGASFLELTTFDGTLDCINVTTTPGDDRNSIVRNLDAANGKPEVQIRRINNVSGDCVAIPYQLANGNGNATFYKPLNSQTSAQFIVTLKWWLPVGDYTTKDNNEELAGGTYSEPTGADIRATTIDFEVVGEPGALKMGWCTAPVVSGGVLNGISSPANAPDMEPNLPQTQHACIGTRSAIPVGQIGTTGPFYYELREQVYLQGDARWSG